MDPEAPKCGQAPRESGENPDLAPGSSGARSFSDGPSADTPPVVANEEELDGEDRRRYDRVTVLWNGKLLYRDEAVDCLIVNISAKGAMVQILEPLDNGTSVILKNDRMGSFAAKVAWSNEEHQYGLQFLDDKHEIAQVLGLILP